MKTIFSFALFAAFLVSNKATANSFSTTSPTDFISTTTSGTFSVAGNWCDGTYVLTVDFGQPNGTYSWLKDGVIVAGATTNTINLVNFGTGEYTVNYHSQDGTQNIIESYDFTTAPGPESNFTSENHMPIGATRFFATSTPGPSPITGWHWDFGDGTSSTEQNPEHFWSQQNTYTVVLTTTDSNGCSNSVTKLIVWQY